MKEGQWDGNDHECNDQDDDAEHRHQGVGRCLMSQASVFRLYAEEAMRESSDAIGETEKPSLEELAAIRAQAALMSDRAFGSSFTSSPRPLMKPYHALPC